MARKWTKESAKEYTDKILKKKGQKGLTFWSATDYLRHYKTMKAII